MNKKTMISDRLFEEGKRIELSKGGILHDVHHECRALGKVLSGKLRLSRLLSSGREIILKEFGPGEIYAELIVFSRERYPGWLIASEPTTVVEVGYDKVLEHLQERDAMIEFITGISKKMTHLTNRIEIMSLKTVKQKVAFSLLSENSKSLPSITDWADYLGCSREALSRAVSELVSGGVIVKKQNSINIENRRALEELF